MQKSPEYCHWCVELPPQGHLLEWFPSGLGVTENLHLKSNFKLIKEDCQWKSKYIHIQIRFSLNIYGESIWDQMPLLISSPRWFFPHAISLNSVWSHLYFLMALCRLQKKAEYFKTLAPGFTFLIPPLTPQYISTKLYSSYPHTLGLPHQMGMFTLLHSLDNFSAFFFPLE